MNTLSKKYIETREVVMDLVPKYAKGRTLDIGGGTSKYKHIIRKTVPDYTVADLYAEGADLKEDARHMTLGNESYDTVLSFQVLEHIDDTERVVKEMHRVLKRGGCAIVTMPFLFPQHGDPSDFHRFTKDAARFYFERAGFGVLELGSQGSALSVLAGMLRQMYLSHYIKTHSRLRRAFFTRLIALLVRLDRRGYFNHPDIYANVYIVGRKN